MIHRANGKSKISRDPSLNRLTRPTLQTPLTTEVDLPAKLKSWIAEHPVASIAAALTLGAFLGWIIKRR